LEKFHTLAQLSDREGIIEIEIEIEIDKYICLMQIIELQMGNRQDLGSFRGRWLL